MLWGRRRIAPWNPPWSRSAARSHQRRRQRFGSRRVCSRRTPFYGTQRGHADLGRSGRYGERSFAQHRGDVVGHLERRSGLEPSVDTRRRDAGPGHVPSGDYSAPWRSTTVARVRQSTARWVRAVHGADRCIRMKRPLTAGSDSCLPRRSRSTPTARLWARHVDAATPRTRENDVQTRDYF